MKKLFYFIFVTMMIVCWLSVKPTTTYAFVKGGAFWGDPTNGVSTKVDPTNPKMNIDPNTVQLGQNPNYTTYKVVTNSTSTFKASDIPAKGKGFDLVYGGSVTITYAGSYKGDIVDLVIYNVNSNRSTASMIVQPNGSLSGYINYKRFNNYGSLVKPTPQFQLALRKHSDGTALSGVPVLLNQVQPLNNASFSNTVGIGFDTDGFRQLYGISNNLTSTSLVYYENQSYPFVTIELVKSVPVIYAYYGTTNGYGTINLYASSMNDGYSFYNVLDASPNNTLYPLPYATTNSTIADTTTDAGKFINISTTQLLTTQKQTNFYPVNGSMELVLSERNIGHLLLNENDFTLSTESGVVSKDNYQLAITYPASGRATITIKLLGDFASKNAGKTLKVSQKSTVNPNQAIINSNLQGNKLPVTIATTLNYKMSGNVQTNTNMSVSTNSVNGLVTVVPDLTATVASNFTVEKGTTMMDIFVDQVVTNMKNVYFPWDEVTAEFANENQTLNVGVNKVNVILKSAKFNYSKIIEATINVTDDYNLTYNGNGGTINGQGTLSTAFTKSGTALLGASSASRKGYSFAGWSTTSTGTADFQAGYNYGTLASEQKNTTLYACWKKDEHQLTYNGNGGTIDGKTTSQVSFTIDGVPLLDGSKVTRKGYTFTGWSKTATGAIDFQAGYKYGTLDAEMSDTTLYACWKIDEYQLTYDGNGGTIEGQVTSKVPFTINGIQLIGAPNVVRDEYTFLGWSTSKTDNSNLLNAGYKYGTIDSERKDTTLYARWEKTTTLKVSWTADTIDTNLTKKIDKADRTIKLPFYWNADKKGTQYLVKQKVGSQQTDLKKVTQENASESMGKDELEVNTESLAYGDNQLTFDFYQLDQLGNVLSADAPDASLTLLLTINGSLRIESVPDMLYWTNRPSVDSIGILDRDASNDIKLSVIDSRENQTKDWSIQTNITMVEKDVPFGFVWKNSASASEVPMNENSITIMDKKSASKTDNYEYSQTWNDKSGILLQSQNKVAEGNYSEKVIVNWTITEGPN